MKPFLFLVLIWMCWNQYSLQAQSDVSFEKVSICFANNATRCLSRTRVETAGENDPFTVEVVLKSNNPRFLQDNVQHIYVEAARMSPNCLRASSNPDNCPPDSYFGWFGLYTSPTSSASPPPLIEDADFIRPQLAAVKKLRQEMLKIPVEIIENRPGVPNDKPVGRLDWPDNKQKPPYTFRFKANGMRFLTQNFHKYLRVTVTLRNGEKISSDHVRINVQ
ncbi:hypothetical protein [Runella sp.]|jgi:hypothetical protein|uniref:hypothetical protein n=1 Tax=Runella sp. TaxID=1960881 RepID=UPI0026218F98|nr:hypothetical protein [Runella sp.]